MIVFDGTMRFRRSRSSSKIAVAKEKGFPGTDMERMAAPPREDPEAWRQLMRAVLDGDAVRFEALLDGGFSLHGEDEWGCTLLHASAQGGSLRLARRLLLDESSGLDVDAQDACNETPLHIAAKN